MNNMPFAICNYWNGKNLCVMLRRVGNMQIIKLYYGIKEILLIIENNKEYFRC